MLLFWELVLWLLGSIGAALFIIGVIAEVAMLLDPEMHELSQRSKEREAFKREEDCADECDDRWADTGSGVLCARLAD